MGIASLNFNQSSANLPSLDSCYSYVDEKAKKVSQLFYDHIIYPVGVGTAAGIADFGFCCILLSIEWFFGPFGIDLTAGFEEEGFDFIEAVLCCSVIPLIEEVIFRVGVQGSIKYVAAKILPDREIDILGYIRLPLHSLVAILATSLLFGALHYPNAGMISVVSATVGGLSFGLLKEKVGLISSCTAHGVGNGLICAADYFWY